MDAKPHYYYVGDRPPPESISDLLEQVNLEPLTPEVAPFMVDTLVHFRSANLDSPEYKIMLRYGRPQLRIPGTDPKPSGAYTDYIEWGSRFARTNYQPIDCNFYDNFEAAIVRRRPVDLEYLDANGERVLSNTRLRDLKTHRTEEFVQLASGEWLRLDRIVSVDGVAAGESCSF